MLAIGKAREQGFTLIESLVVVAIAALISGLMFPRLQGAVQGQEYRMARSAMLLGVRDARARAIRGGVPVTFAVAGDAAGFRVGGGAVQTFPDAVRLRTRSEGKPITFYTDGTSDGGRLTLVGRGMSQDFIVFPTTGLIFEARQ
jgi:general secretion pathway protein H